MSKQKLTDEEFANILVTEGVNGRGYGNNPKLSMEDQRLTPFAKLIYAYFCSYTGKDTHTAFPSVSKILYDLQLSNKTYYKHFKLLTHYGYITVQKQKRKDGRFERNLYILNQYPAVVEDLPHGTISTTEDLPHGKISTTNKTNSFNKTKKQTNINNLAKNEKEPIPAHYYYDWMSEDLDE